jgi:hypothetical protein
MVKGFKETFSLSLEQVESFRAVNRYGTFQVRGVEAVGVDVIAMVQQPHADEAAVKFFHEKTDGQLVLEVRFVDLQGNPVITGASERQVDLTLLVPKGLPLSLETDDGLIKAKGLDQHVVIHTHSGTISLRNHQGAEVTTYQGAVDYFLSSGQGQPQVRLKSVIGDLTVWLPSEFEGKIYGETKGDVACDFSTHVISEKDQVLKQFSVSGTEGRGLVQVETIQGNVRIKKQIKNSSY